MKVETYQLYALTGTGRKVRLATKVTMPDGEVIKFIERMGKKEAMRQATQFVARRNRQA